MNSSAVGDTWQAVPGLPPATARPPAVGAVDGRGPLDLISANFPDGAVFQYAITLEGSHLLSYVGQSFARLVGELPEALPADASWLARRINPADTPVLLLALERSLREFKPFECEVRLQPLVGAERWVSFRAQPRLVPDATALWDGVIIDIALKRRAEESLRRQADFLAALNRITLELVGRRDVPELLQALAARTSLLLKSPRAEIYLLANGELIRRAVSRDRAGRGADRWARADGGAAWRAVETRQPVVLEAKAEAADNRDHAALAGGGTLALCPMLRGAECIGVLVLAREQPGFPFTPEDLQEGMLLAQVAAVVLDNASIHAAAAQEEEARTAAARERALALMRATLESTADAILVVNGDGRIETYNLNFAEMWGIDITHAGVHEKEETLLRTILDQLVTPELLLASVRDLYARSEDEVFDILLCRDGRILERYSRPQLVANHPAGRVWSFRDITEQRRAEAALRESEERFRVLAEVAPVGIFSSDTQGRTVFVNRRWCEIAGLTQEEAKGDGWQAALHPEDRQRVADAWTEAVRGGEASAAEFRFVRPDGEVTSLVGHSRAQLHADGTVAGYVGTVTDVTSLKRAEEERKQLEAQSRQRRKMESLGTLAGGIAHDFNNILTGTFGFVDLARLEVGRDHPVNLWLDRISGSSQRARDLVRQILTFSRKTETERMAQRLHPVVGEALRLLRSTLSPKIRLEARLAEDAPPILADSTQIHQVVLNLCTNAGHAMPDGGQIDVTLESCTLTSDEAAANPDLQPGLWLRLTVADNGSGMDAATLDHIFEPFFTTKGIGIGTGLGLAVVHGIVKSHEGAIMVRSTVGAGSTFELYFPATLDEVVPPQPTPARLPRGNGGHVLVVDDDNVCGFAVEKMIESLGYRATRCTHPEQALIQFTAAPASFDLVISDLAMPGMDGAQLIEEVRRMRPDMPTVIITGYIDTARQRHLEKTGARAVLRKPVSREELARILAQYVPAID